MTSSVGPSGGYFAWLPSIAPRWLTGFFGNAWLSTAGVLLDMVSEGARRAVKARFPEGSAPDAQDAIGADRQLPRIEVLAHENNDAYGARLKNAWNDLAHARSRTGLRIMCDYVGFPSYAIYDQGELNGPHDPWSLCWIVVNKPNPWGPAWRFDEGHTLDSGGVFDMTANIATIANLRAVLRPWIGPFNRVNMLVDLGGARFDDGHILDGNLDFDDGSAVIAI